MIKRYLTIETMPELRLDPIMIDKNTPDLELTIQPDVFYELQDLIKDIRFAKLTGSSSEKLWKKLYKMVMPCLELEKDRIWLRNKIKSL